MGGFGGRGRGRSMMQRNRMMGIPANNAAMAGMSPQSSSFDFMPGMVPIGRMRGGRGHPSAFNAMSPMGMMSMVHDSRFFSPMAMRGPPPSTMNPIFFQGHEDPMLPPQSSSTNAAPYGGGGDRESREFLERKRSPPAIHRDEYSREERRHHRREDHRSREEYREEDRKRSRAQ